eukprot:CAMPEP_0184691254 /NCGR_PEP_ID=MMETSP0313-20130426/149_1 /TAXON_ID=2792 /ORGANISM="Porphyridium aerugineum, Strain SAG 1380-2" /LENGTH=414 /DNA_ID=CAMNT_0027148931 /DNA_START=354 /DNA_END=1598 /DNA_ORIENTATION=+
MDLSNDSLDKRLCTRTHTHVRDKEIVHLDTKDIEQHNYEQQLSDDDASIPGLTQSTNYEQAQKMAERRNARGGGGGGETLLECRFPYTMSNASTLSNVSTTSLLLTTPTRSASNLDLILDLDLDQDQDQDQAIDHQQSFLRRIPTSRTLNDIPNALDTLSEIRTRLRNAPTIWFLDYDGTLAPIVEDPDTAYIPTQTRDTLKELATQYKVAIVSGRSRQKVESFVKLDELFYAGSHGFDIRGPRNSLVQHSVAEKFLPELERARGNIHELVGNVKGVRIEDNWLAFSVHWRMCDKSEVPEIERCVDEVLQRFPSLRKTHGKCVFEVRPRLDWDKGKAVEWLLNTLDMDYQRIVPIYIGDDITDEDAFKVLKYRGISCIVADDVALSNGKNHKTNAHYRLRNPAEVEQFLRAFLY